MANRNFKKAIVFALVLTMLMPLGSMAAFSTEDEADTAVAAQSDDAASGDAATDGGEEEKPKEETSSSAQKLEEKITDEQAIALSTCRKGPSNSSFQIYYDQMNDRWGVFDKRTNKYWWSSPINVLADDTVVDEVTGNIMKRPKRLQVGSSASMRIADLRQKKRNESASPIYSTSANVKYKASGNDLAITYDYNVQGVAFTVHVTLEQDYIYVYMDAAEVVEQNTDPFDGMILSRVTLAPSFGSVPAYDDDGKPTEGYMIVPDGSGAVIKYNNGRGSYPEYNQIVYGRDYTQVPLSAPRVIEQAFIPVLASVQGDDGFVAIATEGDANVYAKAKVSMQDSQVYNSCNFEFVVKSTDEFFLSGDQSNRMKVFEKGEIKTPRVGVRYYPIHKDGGINYADCAEVYRNYLINEKGLTAKTEADNNSLYVDFYGGVLKRTSILGLPFRLKSEITGFDQAAEIVKKLKELGVQKTVVNYNDWTNASIKGKVSTDASASGTLGGNSDFKDFLNTDGATVFPSMNNVEMTSSSLSYMAFTNTAIRISNEYSRQVEYSLNYGVQMKGVAPALIAPDTYVKIFDEMIESYKDEGLKNIGFGDYSTKLVSDFSKKHMSVRYNTQQKIVDGYKKAVEEVGPVLCDGANAYILPYASQIINVPVYSSGFNVTDFDIPFYQMVIHGYVPYASKPINASSNTSVTFMKALAAGSAIHYDMIYEEASELTDTDYDELYYANYEGWIDLAAKQYKAADDILKGVSDMKITKYEVSEDGTKMTTTYSKDGKNVVIEIDTKNATAKVDGKTFDLAYALEGGAEG